MYNIDAHLLMYQRRSYILPSSRLKQKTISSFVQTPDNRWAHLILGGFDKNHSNLSGNAQIWVNIQLKLTLCLKFNNTTIIQLSWRWALVMFLWSVMMGFKSINKLTSFSNVFLKLLQVIPKLFQSCSQIIPKLCQSYCKSLTSYCQAKLSPSYCQVTSHYQVIAKLLSSYYPVITHSLQVKLLPSYCHVIAKLMPCYCQIIANVLLIYCHVISTLLPGLPHFPDLKKVIRQGWVGWGGWLLLKIKMGQSPSI